MRELFVSLLLIGFFGTAAQAATGTQSWTQQPLWASSASDGAPAKRPAGYKELQTSPFAPASNNLSLDVGQVFLMGDLGSTFTDSLGSQVHYTYGVSDIFGFDSSFGYSSHADGKFSMTTFLTGVRTNLAWYDKVIPHAVFGLGFYRPSYQIGTTSLAPILFGLHLGPGVDLELTKQLFFGASLTFHDIFGTTKTTSEGVKDIGGTFATFFLRAGVTF